MNLKQLLICTILVCISSACKNQKEFQFTNKGRLVPDFSSDSAYFYIQEQVNFGPRVPNTDGHQQTRKYLESKF